MNVNGLSMDVTQILIVLTQLGASVVFATRGIPAMGDRVRASMFPTQAVRLALITGLSIAEV
jgi:hypothetical protein